MARLEVCGAMDAEHTQGIRPPRLLVERQHTFSMDTGPGNNVVKPQALREMLKVIQLKLHLESSGWQRDLSDWDAKKAEVR